MVSTTLETQALLPEAALVRLARVVARFLVGRQPDSSGTQSVGRVAGAGQDFLDFRQYQPGDDFRTIDWRASARSNAVQVRRYGGDVSSDWYLCVDASASVGAHSTATWLLARQLSAALAYVLLYQGHRVGLLMFSKDIDAACALGRGHTQYARILRTLNAYQSPPEGRGSDLGNCANAVDARSSLFVISDFLTEDSMLGALVKLRSARRQLHLLLLENQHQTLLPGNSELLLKDVESGRTVMSGEPEEARLEAQRRLIALREELSHWCSRFNVPLTKCHSDDHWRDLLLRHFIRN